MSDFQKWSVLAFRAMDDAGRVLMTIEPESTSEGELLDRLKETIRELLVQALVLNGVTTRRQMDKQFQFGKLGTDALLIAQSQEQAEPPTCAWSSEDEDFMPGTYRSACGELWSYVDGGWKDNRVNFCHGCGGKVVDAAHNIQEPKS